MSSFDTLVIHEIEAILSQTHCIESPGAWREHGLSYETAIACVDRSLRLWCLQHGFESYEGYPLSLNETNKILFSEIVGDEHSDSVNLVSVPKVLQLAKAARASFFSHRKLKELPQDRPPNYTAINLSCSSPLNGENSFSGSIRSNQNLSPVSYGYQNIPFPSNRLSPIFPVSSIELKPIPGPTPPPSPASLRMKGVYSVDSIHLKPLSTASQDGESSSNPISPILYSPISFCSEQRSTSPLIPPPIEKLTRLKKNNNVWVCPLFLSIQVLVLISYILLGGGVAPLEMNPAIGPSFQILTENGAFYASCMQLNSVEMRSNDEINKCELKIFGIVFPSQAFRWITGMFVFKGIIPCIVHISVMINAGWEIEKRNGCVMTLALFFICGFSGLLIPALCTPSHFETGSLGATMGFLGFRAIAAFRERRIYLGIFCWLSYAILTIALRMAYPALTGHTGGITMGFICGTILSTGYIFNRWTATLSFLLVLGILIFETLSFYLKLPFLAGQAWGYCRLIGL